MPKITNLQSAFFLPPSENIGYAYEDYLLTLESRVIYFYEGEVKYGQQHAFYVLQDLILSGSEQYCPSLSLVQAEHRMSGSKGR